MRILLVDDEELQLIRLENEVKKALPSDTEILSFLNPLEALKAIKEKDKKVDIAFLDIEMPGINGISLAKELKKVNPTANIIFVTAYNDYALDAYKLHASGCLPKPVSVNKIKDEIASFVEDAHQSDDITFLTVKYGGSNYSIKEKEFNAKKENIPEMLDFISEFNETHNIQEEFKRKLIIVGDELFSNIIIHGYEEKGGPIFVRLMYDKDNNEYAITIIDKAPAFNQLEVNKEAIGPDAKNIQIGGLGLIIVKKIMNEYAYHRINGKNILVLKKKF